MIGFTMGSIGKGKMASIQKFRKKWKAFVRRKNITVIKTFLKKGDATKWAYHIEAQIETGTYKRVKEAERLADIRLSEILNIYYEKHLKIKSQDPLKEKNLIDLINRLLGKKYITDLTGSELARFRDKQIEEGKSPTTVKKYLGLISRAINRVKREHNIPITINPVSLIEKPQEPPPIERILTDEEWERLLKIARRKDYPEINGLEERRNIKPLYYMEQIIIVARETLCRRGELLRLKREDIDWISGTAHIRKTKNGVARTIGLSPLAIQILRELPDTPSGVFFPIKSKHSFNSFWRKVLRDAELKGIFTFHRLRHQGATDLSHAGWTIAEISAQGGWLSLSSLKRYTHIQPEHLANKFKERG